MGKLSLHKKIPSDVTIISNHFIDDYMIDSNGEFVKIYLYLLRCSDISGTPDLSLSGVADIFNHTEKDILRALRYWEKKQLLQLEFDDAKKLTGINFLDFTREMAASTKVQPEYIASETSKHNAQEVTQDMIAATLTNENYKIDSDMAPHTTSVSKEEPKKAYREITKEDISRLKDNEDIQQLLFIAEQYLGKILSPTETSTILYFYDQLQFSADLVEYLIEYCVSKGSKSIRYIETVALAWAQDGITTVKQAKDTTNMYNKNYFAIMKSFGIKGRNPAAPEIALMNTWINEHCFTMDIIVEACNRTITQTHQPNFKYADKILSQWKKNGVKHLSDIEALDEKHQKTKAAHEVTKAKPITNNKFNNFHQRSYDYDKLEKQLLNSKS